MRLFRTVSRPASRDLIAAILDRPLRRARTERGPPAAARSRGEAAPGPRARRPHSARPCRCAPAGDRRRGRLTIGDRAEGLPFCGCRRSPLHRRRLDTAPRAQPLNPLSADRRAPPRGLPSGFRVSFEAGWARHAARRLELRHQAPGQHGAHRRGRGSPRRTASRAPRSRRRRAARAGGLAGLARPDPRRCRSSAQIRERADHQRGAQQEQSSDGLRGGARCRTREFVRFREPASTGSGFRAPMVNEASRTASLVTLRKASRSFGKSAQHSFKPALRRSGQSFEVEPEARRTCRYGIHARRVSVLPIQKP